MSATARVLIWGAVGDALGVPYENHIKPEPPLVMSGRGIQMAPGEWSDDTSMGLAVAMAALRHPELDDGFYDDTAALFMRWATDCGKGIGSQTSAVTRATREAGGGARAMYQASREYASRHEAAAGNGALMRTAVVGCLSDDRDTVAEVAEKVARLTHWNDSCVDSCVLWSEAIRSARLTGQVQMSEGLDLLPEARRDQWAELIAEAEEKPREEFVRNNGWTVRAFQESWAIALRSASAERAVKSAILAGGDTDTIAAISGSLVGLLHPLDKVPRQWLELLHGWPELDAATLAVIGRRIDEGRQAQKAAAGADRA